jgi:hypothetical protein
VPYFLCRLLPPRPTFIADMTADERALMGAHAKYWSAYVSSGEVVALGPVADPKGAWGLALLEVDSEASVRALNENDPVIKADQGFSFEILAMPVLVVRGAQLRADSSSPS